MARLFEETEIILSGEKRRYYRLYDTTFVVGMPVMVLINGSGCQDFSIRLASFFSHYSFPLNVYYLEKPYVLKDADGRVCSHAFYRMDYLEKRIADTLAFIDEEPVLSELPKHSVALLGFSEGGTVAVQVASQSHKIGWLATAGSGGGMSQSEEFLLFAEKGIPPYSQPYSKDILLKEYAAIQRYPNSLEKVFFGHPYRYWSSYLFFNPLEIYAKLTIPILSAMGELDDCVPVESGRVLQKYFLEHRNKHFTYIEYPGANHRLEINEQQYVHDFMQQFCALVNKKCHAFKTYEGK